MAESSLPSPTPGLTLPSEAPVFRKWLWRGRVLGLCGAVGALAVVVFSNPTSHDVEALAQALGKVSGGLVQPSEVRWEPSDGLWADFLIGRRVLFLSAEGPGRPRDVMRARVHLSPEGLPLWTDGLRNLTGTPLGDDHALVVRDHRAVFVTHAYDQAQSLTLLRLDGDPAAESDSFGLSLMRAITNLQQTGAWRGIGRTEVVFDQPPRRAGMELGAHQLTFDMVDPRGDRRGVVDLDKNDLAVPVDGVHVEVHRPAPKRFVHWAVDTVRAIPWIGPGPIAWLEEKAFAVRDSVKRAAYTVSAVGDGDSATLAAPAESEGATHESRVLTHQNDGEADAGFPPAALRSLWKVPEAGEGVWNAPNVPWLRRLPDPAAPAPFVTTFVRPDEQRPYAKVTLVAMDMRQLDLAMEAGSEDPKPLTGGHGPGRIPRDPAVFTRVAATFNGAFKTEHGNYGMMVKRRVLLPPQPNAATILTVDDGTVALGSWPSTPRGTLDGLKETSIVSLRQNLDPLVDEGRVNPSGRSLWGFTLPGTGMQTERSGVCVTDAGHLMYAWGDDVSALTLGKAMKMAGCVYGMHLDMNPHHTGFMYTAVDDIKTKKYKAQLVSSDMDINAERYIEYATKDFFYVMLRDPAPGPRPGFSWEVSAGAQPSPTWMPAVHAGRWQEKEEAVDLIEVPLARASFRLRAGTREPDAGTGAVPSHELSEEDSRHVLFATTMGVASEKRVRGLGTDGKLVLPAGGGSRDFPTALVSVGPHRGVSFQILDGQLSEPPTLEPHEDVVELPLLLRDGQPLAAASVRGGTLPRGALGVTEDGRVVIAQGLLPSHGPIIEALRRLGCAHAVALDRGFSSTAHTDRAGTGREPKASYEETTLYVVSEPMAPRVRRFSASKPSP